MCLFFWMRPIRATRVKDDFSILFHLLLLNQPGLPELDVCVADLSIDVVFRERLMLSISFRPSFCIDDSCNYIILVWILFLQETHA